MQKGAGDAFLQAISSMFADSMNQFMNSLQSTMMNRQ